MKVAVSDLDRSLAFYESALQARRIERFDHVREDGTTYAYILDVPGLGTLLELRLDPARARAGARFDPITLAVDDRAALEGWAEHLDAHGIRHSGVLVALQAWLLVVEDPDETRLRLYTLETHAPDLVPDYANVWLAG